MALSQFLYIEGDPPFIHHQGKCWRRLTDQALTGTVLVPGIDDVVLHNTANECFGITDLHEIAEMSALVKISPDGQTMKDPTSEIDYPIFHVADLSTIASFDRTGDKIDLHTVMNGLSLFSMAEVSSQLTLDSFDINSRYDVYSDNGISTSNAADYMYGSSNYETVIKPDVFTFLSGLPN